MKKAAVPPMVVEDSESADQAAERAAGMAPAVKRQDEPKSGRAGGLGRRGRKQATSEDPPKDSQTLELERENRDLKEQVNVLSRALRGAVTQNAPNPDTLGGEDVAGRPSLAALREKTWSRFSTMVLKLPVMTARMGREATRQLVAGSLLPDMFTLALGAPPTPRAAKMREALEHILTDRGKLNVLMSPDAAGQAMRTVFLQRVARAYYLPSVTRLFERSQENLLPFMPMGVPQ